MKFDVMLIEEELYSRFGEIYKAFGGFVGSSCWIKCINAVRDETLLKQLIFCNDVLETPPVYTFLRARPIKEELQEFDKRAMGAFWGFVFKVVFKYRNQKSVTARVNTVKRATYFFNAAEPVEIVSDNMGKTIELPIE